MHACFLGGGLTRRADTITNYLEKIDRANTTNTVVNEEQILAENSAYSTNFTLEEPKAALKAAKCNKQLDQAVLSALVPIGEDSDRTLPCTQTEKWPSFAGPSRWTQCCGTWSAPRFQRGTGRLAQKSLRLLESSPASLASDHQTALGPRTHSTVSPKWFAPSMDSNMHRQGQPWIYHVLDSSTQLCVHSSHPNGITPEFGCPEEMQHAHQRRHTWIVNNGKQRKQKWQCDKHGLWRYVKTSACQVFAARLARARLPSLPGDVSIRGFGTAAWQFWVYDGQPLPGLVSSTGFETAVWRLAVLVGTNLCSTFLGLPSC